MTESVEVQKTDVQTKAVEAPKAAPKVTASGVSVARVVHYQEGEGEPLAALVTAVHGRKVSLVIFREHLQMFRQNVPFSEKPKTGHWGWPPRVGA